MRPDLSPMVGPERSILFRAGISRMEKKMETTTMGLYIV